MNIILCFVMLFEGQCISIKAVYMLLSITSSQLNDEDVLSDLVFKPLGT